jgi:hypothetical protein
MNRDPYAAAREEHQREIVEAMAEAEWLDREEQDRVARHAPASERYAATAIPDDSDTTATAATVTAESVMLTDFRPLVAVGPESSVPGEHEVDRRWRQHAYNWLPKSAKVPPIRPSANQDVARVRLFLPEGRWTYYVCAADPLPCRVDEARLYGYLVSPLGPDCDEWGYTSMWEVALLRTRLGLPVERDLDWTPTPMAKVLDAEAA